MITEEKYLDALKMVRDYLKQVSIEVDSIELISGGILDANISDVFYKSEIHVPNRLIYCLHDSGVRKVKDLVCYTRKEVLQFRNMGKRTFGALERILDRLDIQLRLP